MATQLVLHLAAGASHRGLFNIRKHLFPYYSIALQYWIGLGPNISRSVIWCMRNASKYKFEKENRSIGRLPSDRGCFIFSLITHYFPGT